jgi:V/A-type H+-transporting ATPase subunit I
MGGSFSGPDATFATKTSYVIAVVTGNIFVMMMEGMVVFIQCLRLEYYEFFSKFFAGDGIRYQPLEVEE